MATLGNNPQTKEESFDSEDEPSPDMFLQKGMKRSRKGIGDDDGNMEGWNGYDYSDLEAASRVRTHLVATSTSSLLRRRLAVQRVRSWESLYQTCLPKALSVK